MDLPFINIPSIVTTDVSLPAEDTPDHTPNDLYSPPLSSSSHSRSPGDPAFLSPTSGGFARSPFDPPLSPAPTYSSSNDGSSTNQPPSPTLSNRSSVHFATTMALRDNKPEERTGMSSLLLLSPLDQSSSSRGHFRRPSSSSSIGGHSSDGTEPDHGPATPLNPVISAETEVTRVNRSRSHSRSQQDSDAATTVSEGHNRKGKDKDDGSRPNHRVQLEQDKDMNPKPFAFKPYELAHMLDPKNIEFLELLGGVDNLIHGLGTHPTHGLTKTSLQGDGIFSAEDPEDKGAGKGASQRHERQGQKFDEESAVPGIVLTSPDGDGEKRLASPPRRSQFSASLDDRRRIYGENVLPQRPSKSLLALMWAALKDKVLILLSIAAVVSFALGIFQDTGTTLPADHPPVDWVEGVAIMVAIFIVVIVGSLNDWQKERQFQVLNEKKEERGVKVIRDGVQHIIDVKQVVVGDIALLEPGEIIPCDGVFLSGHRVRCDESGATGESDAIKKVTFAECIELREKEGHHGGMEEAGHHRDCFLISGSKVLEGVGSYVVVAVGTKSFNGRIMMALRGDAEHTPLQLKLNRLAELIAKLGSMAGLILFTALMIRFFVQLGTRNPQR